ncbi:hypothetical protein FSP39_012723 [Pinctada imbricata]|uniref:Dynein regulatory complex protein 1 C-terminal domain-containing protein n=1 Tax=Pinctada imbricata TaxID=66713 RepID=A0AA88XUH4_PINIB|nr:hypothetical protein FSP39_012723 [Pinctada imbricata]
MGNWCRLRMPAICRAAYVAYDVVILDYVCTTLPLLRFPRGLKERTIMVHQWMEKTGPSILVLYIPRTTERNPVPSIKFEDSQPEDRISAVEKAIQDLKKDKGSQACRRFEASQDLCSLCLRLFGSHEDKKIAAAIAEWTKQQKYEDTKENNTQNGSNLSGGINPQGGSPKGEKEEDDDSIPADRKPPKSTLLNKISANTIKNILEVLCDESGFLVESKLNKLLVPLEKDERSLMKLDAVFSSLGIDTEEDVHLLASYFMHVKGGKKQQAEEEMMDEIDEEIRKLTGKEGDADSTKSETIELIHPNEVLKALRAFVEENRQPAKEKGKQSQFKIASLEERDSSQDSEYWAKYAKLTDDKRERLWDALLEGLEKYSEMLTGRAGLINETDALRQQNAELRMLLHQYVNSKVNAELEIPPTRVLQLEMNPAR